MKLSNIPVEKQIHKCTLNIMYTHQSLMTALRQQYQSLEQRGLFPTHPPNIYKTCTPRGSFCFQLNWAILWACKPGHTYSRCEKGADYVSWSPTRPRKAGKTGKLINTHLFLKIFVSVSIEICVFSSDCFACHWKLKKTYCTP